MTDVTYNVFLVPGSGVELEVLLAAESVTEIDGAVRIGNITYTAEEDNLSVKDNHTLYQHIRQMLYYANRDGDQSLWPDNVTDMPHLSVSYYVEPEDTEDPEVPSGGDGGVGKG